MVESAQMGDQFSELVKKGSQAIQQNRPQDAIPLLEQAVQMNPESFDALFWLGRCLLLGSAMGRSSQLF